MPVRRCLRSLEFTGSSPKFRQRERDPRVFLIVKRIAVVLPLLCLPFAGMAEVPRALEVPVAIGVLADLPTDAMPPKPVAWTSPTGPIVLHGDLFKDGRHLALVASDGTTLALAGKWNQIDVTKEPKVTPDDIGFDEYADSRRRNTDDWFGMSDNDDRDRRKRGKKYDGGLNNFFQKVLGGL